MPQTEFATGTRRAVLGRRNLLVLALAVITLVAGYALLQAGSTSLAAVLLVVGYCVLFPLAIAL
jgi:uncharacterized membrane protein